ncbi:PKD domain-containing protein [Jatrophihabitans cynanchi]|uniref:PKD domain-containing protein n=1 Tax=Jatrophihabitans cynanchi TaxID=2944128 RepID=A0ABY7JX68_9ACTN|nr:PKD domain-containing protein [Jatrophihabitans sp. SB3-54]WAX55907.1 PKD domain-containing protein [Jatrophihabitans sp. SB3-54]
MSRRAASLVAAAATVLGGLVAPLALGVGPAAADTVSGPPPVIQRTPSAVTADGLPTVQIDGVVWSLAVVGNTAYAGGSFANARPAGAAPGTNLTPRNNLLSFNLSTGVLNNSFAPSLNAQALVVTASPDGSRIYVGGSFTTANGVLRDRIAAYSTATGQLISSFAPNLDATVNAITATNTTVYVGGNFSRANGVPRSRLAAFSAADGSVLGWAPTADDSVKTMVLTPDNSRVIVGGMFLNLNGSTAYGLGALDANNGTLLPWAATSLIQEGGSGSSIADLSTDGTSIYGVGWAFGSNISTLEGGFSADPNSGTLNWIENCWGDVYNIFGVNGTVYNVGHNHGCTAVNGFPDTNPRNFHRSMAFTAQATGTLGHDIGNPDSHSTDFYGQPAPSIMDWWPDLDIGSYTGMDQGPWAVRGNSQYLVQGGEFQHVNGVAQQGLVRFAVSSIAPNKQGPRLLSAQLAPNLVARSSSSVRVAWSTDWDRDDKTLTYTLQRDGVDVYTTTADGQFWDLPTMGIIDTGLSPGTTYTYRVRVNDPDGNTTWGATSSITTPTGSSAPDGAYVKDVLGAGATHYWRLDQAAGSVNYDYAGFDDLTLNSGVTPGVTGALLNDADTASSFDGSTGLGATSNAVPGPNTFTVSAWFSTTRSGGGKIVGFGDKNSGNSSNYDRHIYMDSAGRINFGVYNGASFVITSPSTYRDGSYHFAVGTLSSAGMALYIDGKLIGTNAGTTVGQSYNGYWRVGGDSTWSGNRYFNGSIDDVAIYPTALSAAQIRQQYVDSGRTIVGSTAPSDGYGSTVWNDSPALYYRLDETSGTTATDRSGNTNNGSFAGGYTLGVASPVSGAGHTAVTFDGTTGTLASGAQTAGPNVYSEELWFNTTSTSGGKLIGFGNARTGSSSNYDRHVYMLASGQLVFGTYTGQINVATSSGTYNDGKWHYVVATQGADGMSLYVDGQLVATNPQTQAQSFNGYWRIGGDNLNGWGANNAYFAGTIDEAAVYPTELTPAQVSAHYFSSPAAVNAPPVASFTSSTNGASAAFDATASSDPDGTIASYAWDFGDTASGVGVTPSHTYAASGTYHVTLTVTDNLGATNSVTHDVSVTVPANQPPAAAFTSSCSNLGCSFDAGGSSDPDGSVASYAWDYGDSSAAGSGATPQHTYASGGTYHVTLTVTDNQGATGTVTHDVTVAPPPNQPPTAAFTSSIDLLTASLDGSGSSDPDGSIASYSWDFGDGSGAGSGATTQHLYSAPGSYQVTLTVTDNDGASAFITKTVTVTTVVAADAFGRTVSTGWGTADSGGPWTLTGTASRFSVGSGVGKVNIEAGGVGPTAYLNAVSQDNLNAVVDASVSQSSGNGDYVQLIGRHSGTSDYRLKVIYRADGTVQALMSKVVSGTDTTLRSLVIPGLTYVAGAPLRIRFVVSGNGTATSLSGTVWRVGATEPASPQISVTDSTAALQSAGSFGIQSYISGNSTAVPVVYTYDNLTVTTS